MKFTVPRAALKETLSRACGVCESRNMIPILGNVLLVAQGAELRVTATDMDMEITETLEANVAQQGSITLPASTLHAIIGKAMGDTVSFSLGDRMSVTAGKSKFTLGTLDADGFPVFSNSGADRFSVEIASESLRRLLERTRHAMSSEETRYFLNGVMIEALPDDAGVYTTLRGVATDGHRLARADEMATITGEGEFGQHIVPRKAISEIKKLVDKPEGMITLRFNDRVMTLEHGKVTIKTKMIDGTYPDYVRVIPKETTWEAALPVAELRDAVDRVATVAHEKSKAVKLSFKPDTVTLETRGQDSDQANDEVTADHTAGDLVIGFNATYLTDITTCLKGTFRLRGNDANSPTICDLPDDPTYLQVLMPMRV